MFKSATKIDKTFWSVNRCKSRREFISGAVDPQHVRVEAYHGEVDNGDIRNPSSTVLNQTGSADGDGNYIYQGSVPASESGTYGFSVRVVPTHPVLDANARTSPDHLVVML